MIYSRSILIFLIIKWWRGFSSLRLSGWVLTVRGTRSQPWARLRMGWPLGVRRIVFRERRWRDHLHPEACPFSIIGWSDGPLEQALGDLPDRVQGVGLVHGGQYETLDMEESIRAQCRRTRSALFWWVHKPRSKIGNKILHNCSSFSSLHSLSWGGGYIFQEINWQIKTFPKNKLSRVLSFIICCIISHTERTV